MENEGDEPMKIEIAQDAVHQDAAPPSELAQEPQPMAVDGAAGERN